MKKKYFFITIIFLTATLISFKLKNDERIYTKLYEGKIDYLKISLKALSDKIHSYNLSLEKDKQALKEEIDKTRLSLKSVDFWLRYLNPIEQKKINGPLPVEWETEAFEKFEKPYKRQGAGLSLAYQYLEEKETKKDSLQKLIQEAIKASIDFSSDSIIQLLDKPGNFYFCNRLFLLNLASIYTTGFECPNTDEIINELEHLVKASELIYQSYNLSYPDFALTQEYLEKYNQTKLFVEAQSKDFKKFNHYQFIRDFVNPLFTINQQLIRDYQLRSTSMLDFSLNNNASSIFSKSLFRAQNTKGIYLKIQDEKVLHEIKELGKLLFYEPLLSGNNMRTCASCHQSQTYFSDTTSRFNLQYNRVNYLERNTPSLVNSQYNHLLMLEGKHLTQQEQLKAVVSNSIEMNETSDKALDKVLSCDEYKTRFKELLTYTPLEKKISFEHLSSAIIYYYSSFGNYYAPFDLAMNQKQNLNEDEVMGFNIFMSKAQCGTCHFIPQFNGVKPPFIGSEFEVIGVPATKESISLSGDLGRYKVNPTAEMHHAFRTGSLRNIEKTSPYMHNGVYKTLQEVIEFYNVGGGVGKGFYLTNQTLSSDSLQLTKKEIDCLLSFMKSLNEDIPIEEKPKQLPISKIKEFNQRKVGGDY